MNLLIFSLLGGVLFVAVPMCEPSGGSADAEKGTVLTVAPGGLSL